MNTIVHVVDVLVVGGGFAGTCAAIASARQGATTALVEQRGVLGGNGSSLVRVHIGGAPDHGWQFDARETGIIEEIRLTYAIKDPKNSYAWIDHVLHDMCVSERNLTVYYDMAIDDVKTEAFVADGYAKRIIECSGLQQGTETRHVFKAKVFVDGTGDGTLGALAGVEFRMGREAKAEFGETLAPDIADSATLGSSILFEARDTGHPVSFTPPAWAKKLPKDYSDQRRNRQPTGGREGNGYWHGAMHVGWWWVEYGGRLDTIRDNEAIKQELLSILYGLWDHVKNSGDPRYANAANYDITWVGAIPGKRESRRIIGDYILTQQDVIAGTVFADQVAAGGWNIDLHPPDGFYDNSPPCSQTRLKDLYTIPYRSIYSKTASNLFMASRCLSVTHVAHGTTRLQGTLAAVGQAAGIAAAWCSKDGISPRVLGKERFVAYQQELLKNDGFLIDLRNSDPADLARHAIVAASSTHPLHFDQPGAWIPLFFPVAQQFPAIPDGDHGEIHSISILVKNSSGEAVHLDGGIRESDRVGDLNAQEDISRMAGECPARSTTWVPFELDRPISVEAPRDLARPRLLWFHVDSTTGTPGDVSLGKDIDHYPGFRGGYFDEDAAAWKVARIHDGAMFFSAVVKPRGVYCFSIPGFTAFPAGNVTNGFHRPGKHGPNLWMSDPAKGFPQWLVLDFGIARELSEIHLTFDNGLDKPYPHFYRDDYAPWPVYGRPPRCPKDLDIVAIKGGKERIVAVLRENYQRKITVKTGNVTADQVKIVFHASNGAREVGVYEIRVY
ncbi:MAG: FAD-dependent oxidoreductase [Candidatus Sigynarchaeota archaeon]